MNRQPGFEKLYAKMHDIDPEDLVQYRFGSKDGYRLPQIASHYRLYCETLDSVVVVLPKPCREHMGIAVYSCRGPFFHIHDVRDSITAAGAKWE